MQEPIPFYNEIMGILINSTKALLWVTLLVFSLEGRAEINIQLASQLGAGRMGNVSAAPLSNRAVGTFSFQAVPGYQVIPTLTGGLSLEYRLISQFRASDVVGNDVSGSGFLLGPTVTFHPGLVKLLVGYDVWAKHSHSTPDTSFSGSGWRFQVGYQFMPNIYFDLSYSSHRYGSRTQNDAEANIGSDPLQHWNFGLGASLFY
jgi:hypothetical protein